jgi:hypothetical protein
VKKTDSHRIILEDNTRYAESEYDTEKDLENLAIKNQYALFGENTIYFDKKMLITSIGKISKVPDGLFLDVNSRDEAKLWIVEYELSTHDVQSHIFPQIAGFVKALKSESTKKIIRESIYKTIRENHNSVAKIKSILSSDEEVYYFLELVLDRGLGIVIVIDKKTPELEEIVDSISKSMDVESQILEFITFENDKGKKIHILDSLQQTQIIAKTSGKILRYEESWEVRLSKAFPDLRDTINQLISMINKEFRCVGKPWFKWYGFYLEEPTQRKNLFAVIMTGRNTSSVCFRVNSSKFNDEYDKDVRGVSGFFFPSGTERRIYLEKDKIPRILKHLKHSFETTKEQF